MKRPSFQFYPGDWTSNSNLRRCSHAEKGIWIDVMCLLHDQEEYGIVRWPLKEIAQAVNCTVMALRGLVAKGILKGADAPQEVEPFIYVPRSGRKDGEPVTLVPTQVGPLWYSSRMVKDEYVRRNAGASTRFGADGEPPKGRAPNPNSERAKLRQRVLAKTNGHCHHCGDPLGDVWEIDHLMPRSKGGRHTFDNMVPSCVPCNQDKSDTLPDDWDALKSSPTRRDGERQGSSPTRRQGAWSGDGSSASSSSSPSRKTNSVPNGTDAEASRAAETPPGLTAEEAIFQIAVPWLVERGVPDRNARSLMGAARKQLGDEGAWGLAAQFMREKPVEPAAWISAAINARIKPAQGRPNKQQQLEAKNREIAERLAKEGS